INALTLLDIQGDPESLEKKRAMLPVVRYAVNRRIESATPDYWDHATLLELAVLDQDETAASQHLDNTLAAVREPWEPETTHNNLAMIRDARLTRGVDEPWLSDVIHKLGEAK
ncbi:MAG: DUF4071 domain-containing protein, partial [Gammaproteobacteria bacterium]|nr:DUF4071 domain-containing protein [Gammaproteobacteria bacterium]